MTLLKGTLSTNSLTFHPLRPITIPENESSTWKEELFTALERTMSDLNLKSGDQLSLALTWTKQHSSRNPFSKCYLADSQDQDHI